MIIDEQRAPESFQYRREINRPFAGLDVVISWCKQELIHDWRWQVVEMSSDLRPGKYRFFFDSDRDACAFMLKWSNWD